MQEVSAGCVQEGEKIIKARINAAQADSEKEKKQISKKEKKKQKKVEQGLSARGDEDEEDG